jgi:hypothetical protein
MTDRRSGLRDRLGGSGRHHTDALVDVLPPGLPPEEARSKALREHNRVAKAFEGGPCPTGWCKSGRVNLSAWA